MHPVTQNPSKLRCFHFQGERILIPRALCRNLLIPSALSWNPIPISTNVSILPLIEIAAKPPVSQRGRIIHCGLMAPWGDIALGQHWLRKRLVNRRPLPEPMLTYSQWGPVKIIWEQFHQEIPQPPITNIIYLNFRSNNPGSNELRCIYRQHIVSQC